ncbi:hypothetical protein ACFSQE_08715 [Vogesella fluminis]|uniref:Cytochrome C oxidase subunit IV n=1 Tax=Vogesella fluminis TaxID=1069161 RepID=A0ABQ3HBR6_9NEIS|nr:hypothetical protein [Vogesella fluminis]GHD80912.1 hypothetical protein GCM10011419_26160 [Vogesella fluminis]
MNSPRISPPVWPAWLWLSALTLLLALLSESHTGGVLLAVLTLGGAWLKGVAIIESLMALRHAPLWLRGIVHGWLLLVCGGLLISFT